MDRGTELGIVNKTEYFTIILARTDHKTFSIIGHFPIIREALKQRGWVEKVELTRAKPSRSLMSTFDDDRGSPIPDSYLRSSYSLHAMETEASLMTRLLRDVPVDFLWSSRHDSADTLDLDKGVIISKLPRPHFTSKVGLCNFLQQIHWFCEDGVSHTRFPRCYNICTSEERIAFIADFRLTACLGLLKWLVSKYETGGDAAVKSANGKIPLVAVQFALKRCCEYISIKSHEDIDKDDICYTWDHQWDQFLTWYYKIAHENVLLMDAKDPPIQVLFTSAKSTLLNMRRFWPQMNLDGYLNIWILKPGNKCRGRGIQLLNRLEHVLCKINPAMMKESRYVVQKYIERPLLIHQTKFDIRQWFLVTSTHPLTVWLYRESYLRFCSQPFSLRNLHESVHLCNNAVQCKYKNAKRDPALPDENMWDNYTFKTYLRAIGQADKWEKCIYPGMRESIIGVLLASQDHMDRRKNAFELFGADFMVTEDFTPWLIEINSSPCMAPTTSVTARMCAQCLEDVIKVVIDRRYSRRANTGMFELVYKQHIPPAPPYLGMSLSVRGKKIKQSQANIHRPRGSSASIRNCYSRSRKREEKSHRKHKPIPVSVPVTAPGMEVSKTPGDYIGPIIVDLIEDLARQLDQAPRKNTNILTESDLYNIQQRHSKVIEENITKKNTTASGSKTSKLHCSQKSPLHSQPTPKKKKDENVQPSNKNEPSKPKDASEETQKSCRDFTKTERENGLTHSKNIAKITADDFLPKRMKCNSWKNSDDAMKSMELFNEWRQKLDRTRASCEDMLAKLKMSGENEHLSPKIKVSSVDNNNTWDGENVDNPTIGDIIKKLSLKQPEREIYFNSRKGFMDPLPEYESKDREQKKLLNLGADESSELSQKNKESPHRLAITPHVYHLSPVRDVLPHISKQHAPSTSSEHDRKTDNFYAVGMSLKSLRASFTQKEHLLMPLGSDRYFEMNSAITQPMGGNFL
ncbi:tubulin glycylase 3A-like [Anabrus simplex]|uniref:tubulin glycylase 3A-like n=1 Tax=Anabrus simplex TaxID=316456 RepID=UPI0035A267E7